MASRSGCKRPGRWEVARPEAMADGCGCSRGGRRSEGGGRVGSVLTYICFLFILLELY